MTTKESDRVRKFTESDTDVIAFKEKIAEESLEALEGSARQIITLVTSMLGLFIGILAFNDEPVFLAYLEVKVFAVIGLGLLMAALLFGLAVIIPRRHMPEDMKAARKMISNIFQHKQIHLSISVTCFGLGLIFFLLMIISLVLFRL